MVDHYDILAALIRHAGSAAAGEDTDWSLIEAGMARVIEDAQAPQKLRLALRKINSPDTARVLSDWFHEFEMQRAADMREAERPGEKIVAPIQATGLAATGTAAVLSLAGTLHPLAGILIGGIAILMSAGATAGRWRLSKRADAAKGDAERLAKLAAVAREGL